MIKMKKNKKSEKSEDRREFLKNGLRTLMLGGIVFISGLLVKREISSTGSESLCKIEMPCRNCSKYRNCKVQKAEELK